MVNTLVIVNVSSYLPGWQSVIYHYTDQSIIILSPNITVP